MPFMSTVDFIIPPTKQKTAEQAAFFAKLLTYKKALIFSPHLDDTLLCMGGLLSELTKQRQGIVNYNIYTQCSAVSTDSIDLRLKLAGVPDWRDYSQMRQDEDRAAFEGIDGVEIVNLDFVDCLWRHDSNHKTFYETAFSQVHEGDDHLERLESTIRDLVAQPGIIAFCPLARGRHVDHVIVRDILTKLGVDLVYYMDFPYSQKYGEESDFIARQGLISIEWPGPYEQKADLLQHYTSQHQSLFQPQPFPLEYERFYLSAAFAI
jgi:LmbE family N-acetylglucosaminyl deacetylase